MEEVKEKIEADLTYYQSGIRQLYLKSYQRYALAMLVLMLLTGLGIGASALLLRVLLIVLFLLEAGVLLYIVRFMRAEAFEKYYQTIVEELPKTFQKMQDIEPQEDQQAYYFIETAESLVKIRKKNARNFPSKISQYTLLVGYSNEFGKEQLEQPLQFFYYDITQMKHADSYKKEMLKNANFAAKRTKRKLQSALITIIIVALLGTVVYSYAKSYFEEKQQPQYEYEYDVEE
ncbi:hypothetical protein [Enterococcus sp. UD-01]|jgi:disulfide bond formation protein DsbB|uniref:hypothetical protein n=1 Tax=Enterococcus sp. UD-01 TaxID=3373911 RepID=UPI0038384320